MITLCMDTSHRYLTLVLLKDDEIIESFQQECFKKQSETILVELDNLFKKANINKSEINSVCITKGPGSYTGIRIAMTIAKILCSMKNIPLYTISTLRLYACAKKNCAVLLDARGQRAYVAIYKDGELVDKEMVTELNGIKDSLSSYEIMGDRHLLGFEMTNDDYANSFKCNQKYFELTTNIHCVVPEYLKENDSYMVK